MKTALFDVVITAYGDIETGATTHGVRIVSRYKQDDGRVIGEKKDCSLPEAMQYASGAVVAFLEGTEA
jgi:hypothetical protein